MGESLSNPYGIMGRAAMEMMRLTYCDLEKTGRISMQNEDTPITRRTLVAGAAAGTSRARRRSASAQRCPPAAARTKGPAVFRDLDQLDIDEGYDNDVYAFNSKTISERRVYNNRIAQAVLAKPQRVKYGPAEIERLDFYRTKQPNAPVLMFIHGGSWRGGRAEQFTAYAEPFVRAGANFAVLDFTSVRETDGDIFPMVDQCRRAVAWTLPQRQELRRQSRRALSDQPLVRQPSGELRPHHRMGEAGAAAQHRQRRGDGIGHVRPCAGAALEALRRS